MADSPETPKQPEEDLSDAPLLRGGGHYHRNWLSILGACLLVIGFFSGLLFNLIELISGKSAAYAGFLYAAFMGLVVFGFVLIPAGMLRERKRRKAGMAEGMLAKFHLDLRNPTHRNLTLALVLGSVTTLAVLGIGSYQIYHATETTEFCGTLCHEVMKPEWTAYQNSSHARVKCVECHIGAGAGWFVRAKISGMKEVYATIVDNFERPIATPIHDLRPARETCEECHWRRKFIGYKEVVRSYFLADEENTRHQLRMLVKIGGEKTAFMKGSGIHYHMLIANKVEYIATDPSRQEIASVRVEHADGSVTEYTDDGEPLSEKEWAGKEVRIMDCMDCHNRPSHQFPAPMVSVNRSLEEGTISLQLPFIKRQAVMALDREYSDTEQAMAGIASEMSAFYQSEYPELVDDQPEELQRSIQEIQRIYQQTIFPEMKASWAAYPDNLGHRDSPGCFRCHNDEMQSAEGETITTTCNACHVILAQGEEVEEVRVNLSQGLPFVHPEDFDELDEYTECVDCHTGGADVYE
jgi:nitrate/TMAO reductase-like tetraheme cytochrome c subunit